MLSLIGLRCGRRVFLMPADGAIRFQLFQKPKLEKGHWKSVEHLKSVNEFMHDNGIRNGRGHLEPGCAAARCFDKASDLNHARVRDATPGRIYGECAGIACPQPRPCAARRATAPAAQANQQV